LKFVALDKGETYDQAARGTVFLVYNDWDDWFEFETRHYAVYIDLSGTIHRFGYVKIGQKGQTDRRASLNKTFKALPLDYFSLGQDEDYYKSVYAAGISDEYFKSMRDMAFDLKIFKKYSSERVATTSLFRSVDGERIQNRFNRLARGNASLSPYSFSYEFPDRGGKLDSESVKIDFEVMPDSEPPTNVHVLIGRNGVGKTTAMTNLIRSYLKINDPSPGSFEVESDGEAGSFSNIVSVTFSAFDPFFPSESKYSDKYQYIGLKRALTKKEAEFYKENTPDNVPEYMLKNDLDLRAEFVKTADKCRKGVKLARWKAALTSLSADPLFSESEVDTLCDFYFDDDDWHNDAREIFGGLSSGHKIVLLIISRLVELVQERSLVLLDEPEGHLHPPLLSAFVRALSDLLIKQNGVALIATHSPVVLQEVPRSCVWILNRAGRTVEAYRPSMETFGENVGELTHEVFGLEVTETGFYRMINEVMTHEKSLVKVQQRFGQQLGTEATAIASALEFLVKSRVVDEKSV